MDSRPIFYTSNFFSLSVKIGENRVLIKMQLHIDILYTSQIPHTFFFLKEKLPGVLNTKCFNKTNTPFCDEVIQTEIGHLFEHILLEYLCIEKLQKGNRNVAFNGITNWNWQRDKRGVFHISIDAGEEDKEFFYSALGKSISLLESLINSKNTDSNFSLLSVSE